jgi:hypothetical protein
MSHSSCRSKSVRYTTFQMAAHDTLSKTRCVLFLLWGRRLPDNGFISCHIWETLPLIITGVPNTAVVSTSEVLYA